MIRTIFSTRIIPLVLLLGLFLNSALAQNWKELSGEHFIVFYTTGERFAKDVEDKAEYYYMKIALELGYPRYSDFWTWDKRVKIYIYPDHTTFINATGQPVWSKGVADYTNKTITSFVWSENFLTSLLPHEIAHLIFRDFVGFKGEIPLWLDEGVAQWMEIEHRDLYKAKAKEFYNKNAFLMLDDMMKFDLKQILEANKVFIRQTITRDGERGILFLSSQTLLDTYYLQSVSLVGFLIEKYGSDRFAEFCRQLRDGKSLNDALAFSYPVEIRDVQELEKKWRDYLRNS